MKRTAFFQSARAVFQGGGVKGIALIGAYKAAFERGVNFSEVAGTSAGSIIAALIAGGGSPNFLTEKARSTNFSELLSSPTKEIELHTGTRLSLAACLLRFSTIPHLGRILKYGGAYSSTEIERWLNGLLQELLGIHNRTIRFSDLLIPTTIVAADLTNGQKKVWSSKRTPDDSVAFAARCSCSIPGFFQPVAEGNVRYVDGGILSNLPTFVYVDDELLHRQERILAFRLTERAKGSMGTPKEMFERVIETVIDGTVELQSDLIPGVHQVEVIVEGLSGTDFHAIDPAIVDSLVDQGYRSATAFFDQEASRVAGRRKIQARDLCRHEGDVYANLVECIRPNMAHVIVARRDTRWFWQCFPTFLAWRIQGVPVTVLCGFDEDDREKQRRLFLGELGATVTPMSPLPVEGFMYMAESAHSMLYLSMPQTDGDDAPYATVYRGIYDEDTIRLVYQRLASASIIDKLTNKTKVELKRRNADELIRRLKIGVTQYGGPSVSIKPELVDLNDIKVLNRYLRTHKYKQIQHLHDAYQRFDLEPFETASVCVECKSVSTVTPPIVEEHNGELVVIEGNTRVFYCWRNNISPLHALVVRGVTDPLPGIPRHPRKMNIDITPRHGDARIEGFTYEYFRKIERAARPLR